MWKVSETFSHINIDDSLVNHYDFYKCICVYEDYHFSLLEELNGGWNAMV